MALIIRCHVSPKGKVALISKQAVLYCPYIWGGQQGKPSLQIATLALDVTHKHEKRDRKKRAALAPLLFCILAQCVCVLPVTAWQEGRSQRTKETELGNLPFLS